MSGEVFIVPGFTVRRLGDADVAELDWFHLRCADFVELVEGRPPAGGDGLALLHDRPARVPLEDKIVFGVYAGAELAGVVELLRDHPSRGIWCLGTLLLDPAHRGSGLGAAIYVSLSQWIAGNGGTAIRLIVQRQNPGALKFWERQGFKITGSSSQETSARTNVVDHLEQVLGKVENGPDPA